MRLRWFRHVQWTWWTKDVDYGGGPERRLVDEVREFLQRVGVIEEHAGKRSLTEDN